MYTNFNGVYGVKADHYREPRSVGELVSVVRGAGRVRVVGSVHTFNDMSLSRDTMIDMRRLDRILEITSGSGGPGSGTGATVTVEAGIRLGVLLRALEVEGLTLPVMTATDRVSIAGAVSTGAHGSDLRDGSMSSLVVGAEMIVADGSVVRVTGDDPDLLRAVRCGLGCLGALYSLSLRCVPSFSIRERTMRMPWQRFCSEWLTDRERLSRFPYSDARVDQWSPELVADVTLREPIPFDRRVGAEAGYLTGDSDAKYIEIELAFDLGRAREAVEAVAQFHRHYARDHRVSTDSPLYVRFSDADDTLLSMASGRRTVYVSTFFDVPAETADVRRVERFMAELSERMVTEYDARPHYGKQHSLTEGQMRLLYGDRYSRFLQVKQKLDPGAKFSNDYIQRLMPS